MVPRCILPVGPDCTVRSTYVRTYGIITVGPNESNPTSTEGNNMSTDSNGRSDRHFFMTIVPTNTSGEGDPACKLVVIEHICVISEPINATHANDMDVLDRARVQVAQRLGVPVENVEY